MCLFVQNSNKNGNDDDHYPENRKSKIQNRFSKVDTSRDGKSKSKPSKQQRLQSKHVKFKVRKRTIEIQIRKFENR